MELNLIHADASGVRAGYSCPCGCTPAVDYRRSAEVAHEGCCCGNEFAVGPDASAALTPKTGFRQELQVVEAPWGEQLEDAWLVGPSVHGPSGGHDHAEHADHEHDGAGPRQAIDPVCGMTVTPEVARGKGLHSTHAGTDYFFCGKGCKLEFDDDPAHYLDPSYVPSM